MAAGREIALGEFPDWLRSHLPFGYDTRDKKPLLKRFQQAMVLAVRQNFQKGCEPTGTPWKPLRYARPRGSGADQPLRDTGILMASATAQGGRGHVERFTDNSIEIGTMLEYASVHQDGGVIRPRNAKCLAIPLTREAVTAGGPRRFPRKLTLVWPKGAKSGWLVEDKAAGDKAQHLTGTGKGAIRVRKSAAASIMHFKLVPYVRIPARPYLGFGPGLLQLLDKITLDFLDGGGGQIAPSGPSGPLLLTWNGA